MTNKEKCEQSAARSLAIKLTSATASYITTAFLAAKLAIINPIAAAALIATRHIVFLAQTAIAYVFYKNALDKCDPTSPLILDLDGDGVEANTITYFDHESDGWSELSRWTNEDDGMLVWDRNGDGKINDGSELFGNNAVIGDDGETAEHGFAALAELDSNDDGVVDSNDSDFANLRVLRWTDANDNNMMDTGEERLVTLADSGVQSLNTTFVASDKVDDSGNEHRQVGSFSKTDGTTAEMTDVWLVTDHSITKYDGADIPSHSATIAALPEVVCQGRVYA